VFIENRRTDGRTNKRTGRKHYTFGQSRIVIIFKTASPFGAQ